MKAKIAGLTLVLAFGVVYGPAAPAHAEGCEAHLATHGTTKNADIRYHMERGQHSPCGTVEDQPQQQRSERRVDNSRKNDYDDDYSRSRWKDKTSFDCGWSWKGGFGC